VSCVRNVDELCAADGVRDELTAPTGPLRLPPNAGVRLSVPTGAGHHALRELAPRYGFGFVDVKPLRKPEPAKRVAGYLSKYLAKWRDDGTLEVSETVRTAGRTLVNYVSRTLTARSGCTMRALRSARMVWAWR
jgi:hypothetical protein